MNITVVSNMTDLITELHKSDPVEIIYLAPGDYGRLALIDLDFSHEVTLKALDANRPPEFDNVNLWNVQNLTIDSIFVEVEPDMNTVEWSSAFNISQSSNISIINSTMRGGDAINGIDPDAPAGEQGIKGINGFAIGRGITVNGSEDITINNNEISHFTHATRIGSVDGLEMVGNTIFDIRKTAFGIGDSDDVLIEGNTTHSFNPWKYGNLGDHGDFVHIMTRKDQEDANENIAIRANHFYQGDGPGILGISFNHTPNEVGFKNVVIENNVINNSNSQAIRAEGIDGLKVINNTIGHSDIDEHRPPSISLLEGTRNVVVEGNITGGIKGDSSSLLDDPSIFIGDNYIVQTANPLEEGFIGDVFQNALVDVPSLVDMRLSEESPASGYGSRLPAEAQADAITIEAESGEGTKLNVYSFDVLDTGIDFEGATVLWDFNDGTVDEGPSVQHTFQTEGVFQVTATITTADGAQYIVQSGVHNLLPIPLQAYFDPSATDAITFHNDITTIGDVSGDGHLQINADRSALKFATDATMTTNEAFSVSVAFKKDADQIEESGRLIHFGGTMSVDVQEDRIQVLGGTSTGDKIVLAPGDIGIANTDWHMLTYTYSQDDGQAVLYLNGTEIASQEGLTGLQASLPYAGLHIGNPFGATFQGEVDNLVFARVAFDAEDVGKIYDDFLAPGDQNLNPLLFAEVLDLPEPVSPAELDIAPSFEIDFEAIQDFNDLWSGDVWKIGTPEVHETDGNMALDLSGDKNAIGFAVNDEMQNNTAYTVGLNFQKHEGYEDEGGRLLHFSGTASVTLGDTHLTVIAQTDFGERILLRANGLDIENTDWHRVTFTYSQEEGTARLYLNGEEVASQGGFLGAQSAFNPNAFYLGSPFHNAFEGNLDDFQFAQKALTADQITTKYDMYAGTESTPIMALNIDEGTVGSFDSLEAAGCSVSEDIHDAPVNSLWTGTEQLIYDL